MSCSKTQCIDAGEARTAAPLSRVKHSTTEPLHSLKTNVKIDEYIKKVFTILCSICLLILTYVSGIQQLHG